MSLFAPTLMREYWKLPQTYRTVSKPERTGCEQNSCSEVQLRPDFEVFLRQRLSDILFEGLLRIWLCVVCVADVIFHVFRVIETTASNVGNLDVLVVISWDV
eukprot:m.265767 g.265767  ORF g.265767 m.265767 type:complete len:102 (-) comp63087_c0_seq1:59-364(-)